MGLRLLIFALVLFAGFLIIGFTTREFGAHRLQTNIGLGLADALIALAAAGIGYYSTVTLTARKMFAAHARITGKSYTFDESGMQYVSSTTSSFTKWAAFTAVRETRNEFLLFYPNRLFQLIPKRNVEPGREAELRALFGAKVR